MIYIETFNILDLFKNISYTHPYKIENYFSSDIMEEIIKTFTFNDVGRKDNYLVYDEKCQIVAFGYNFFFKSEVDLIEFKLRFL